VPSSLWAQCRSLAGLIRPSRPPHGPVATPETHKHGSPAFFSARHCARECPQTFPLSLPLLPVSMHSQENSDASQFLPPFPPIYLSCVPAVALLFHFLTAELRTRDFHPVAGFSRNSMSVAPTKGSDFSMFIRPPLGLFNPPYRRRSSTSFFLGIKPKYPRVL